MFQMFAIFAGPDELIAMLSNNGLFMDALKLCDRFNISKCYALENLALQCVRISQHEDPHAWNWLLLNDVSGEFHHYEMSFSMETNFFSFQN